MTQGQFQDSGDPGAVPAPPAVDEFDEIIYHITHDVRSTLRALKTLPSWLRDDLTSSGAAPSTSVMDILQMIEQQADRADQILLDLRTYSRIGRVHEEPKMIPLDEAIREAVRRNSIPSAFNLQTDLKVKALRMPRNECRELFAALISNAVKHHDRDDGTISIRSVQTATKIRLDVDDDGPGIPEQFRERVFKMMSTLRARDECPGSGLGLSIVRKIVTQLGGTVIAAEPPSGRGTRISIELPAQIAGIAG